MVLSGQIPSQCDENSQVHNAHFTVTAVKLLQLSYLQQLQSLLATFVIVHIAIVLYM